MGLTMFRRLQRSATQWCRSWRGDGVSGAVRAGSGLFPLGVIRIKKQTGAEMTSFDPQRRLKIKLQRVQIRRALRAGKRLHDPQVAKMNLPEIDVGPDSAKRTKGHRPLQAATTLQTFHKVKIRILPGRSMTQIPAVCLHQGPGMARSQSPSTSPYPSTAHLGHALTG